MYSKKKNARIAGIWYLVMAITAAFGIMYTPTNILVVDDASATAQNIVDSDWGYRLSIISNLFGQACFIFLVLSLDRLLKEVDPDQSRLMVILVMVAVPIAFLNTLNLVAAQLVANGADYLSVFETEERNAIVMGFLNLYLKGILIVQIFWGLWLLPFGKLVVKSKFIPKIIGVFLVIGCFAYLADSFIGFMLPQYKATLNSILMLPLAIGEFSIIFWLLIKGVKEN